MRRPPVIHTTASMLLAAVLLAPGCAAEDPATGHGPATEGATRTLNIHVSASLRGWPDSVRAAQLAVEEADGRAGQFAINVIVHDESSADAGTDPEQVARNAEEAAADPDAIAYVGDNNSGSTAISAPILNRAGLLQVTPVSTYVGLTRSAGAAPGEPEKYQPTGQRTLARVVPADHIQARAGVVYAQEVGIQRLGVIADETLFGQGLANLVSAAAGDVDLDVVRAGTSGSLAAQAREVTTAGADGVYVAACAPPGEVVDLAQGLANAKIITGDCYVSLHSDVPQSLPGLNDRFFVTAPGGGLGNTPRGRQWFERWQERVGTAPDDKLLFAYEAMSAVLAAIERAGDDGGDRAAVVREFFATTDRDSILGRYSIDSYGDTTLRAYGGYAVRDGRLRFDRVLDTGG